MATVTIDQDVPIATDRPGLQTLEVRIVCDGYDAGVPVTFPKPFRTAAKVISWARVDGVANLATIAVIEAGATSMIVNFGPNIILPLVDSETFYIYVLGELAGS
jgi:hypothetical protein